MKAEAFASQNIRCVDVHPLQDPLKVGVVLSGGQAQYDTENLPLTTNVRDIFSLRRHLEATTS